MLSFCVTPSRRARRCWALSLSLLGAGPAAQAADACRTSSGAARATVVELYTSEGCNSCPPADRWLGTIGHGDHQVALAFHVDYWDRLGWTDRFADPAYTARQQAVQHASGARFVYTPQVIVDGRDWRHWPALPSPGIASVQMQLQRVGLRVTAQVATMPGQPVPVRLAGYWAVVEDGQVSQVRSGENAGATLHHDHVVRHYQPVAEWTGQQTANWTYELTPSDVQQHRRVVFVVTDAATLLPLQALELGC